MEVTDRIAQKRIPSLPKSTVKVIIDVLAQEIGQ